MSVRRAFYFCVYLCLIDLTYGANLKLIHPKMIIKNGTTHTRISGGQQAREGQFPYMVFMVYQSSSGISRCSASLVAWDKVLLAAHCFGGDSNIDPQKVFVVAGKTDMNNYIDVRLRTPNSQPVDENSLQVQERRAEEVQIMPDFKECTATCNHDVALISVKKPFLSSETVNILPISRLKITEPTSCLILGWGFKEDNADDLLLMYGTSIQAVPLSECKYKSEGEFYCLKSRTAGICQGDSGSPLVCNNQAYGVASHTLSKTTNAVCGDDMEEYYAVLASEMDWLEPLLAAQPSRGAVDVKENNNSNNGVVIQLSTSKVGFCLLICLLIQQKLFNL